MNALFTSSSEDVAVEVLRYLSSELVVLGVTTRKLREMIDGSRKLLLKDRGFVGLEVPLKAIFETFVTRRRSPRFEVRWSGVDAGRGDAAVRRVEAILRDAALCSEDRLIVCTDISKPVELSFLGERWRLGLKTKGDIRQRHANGLLSHRSDDQDAVVELQLLPTSRCYPNCNHQFHGDLVVAILNSPLSIKIDISGCYTFGGASPELQACLTTNGPLHVVIGIRCTDGWDRASVFAGLRCAA